MTVTHQRYRRIRLGLTVGWTERVELSQDRSELARRKRDHHVIREAPLLQPDRFRVRHQGAAPQRPGDAVGPVERRQRGVTQNHARARVQVVEVTPVHPMAAGASDMPEVRPPIALCPADQLGAMLGVDTRDVRSDEDRTAHQVALTLPVPQVPRAERWRAPVVIDSELRPRPIPAVRREDVLG